jgi:hypothetical protein
MSNTEIIRHAFFKSEKEQFAVQIVTEDENRSASILQRSSCLAPLTLVVKLVRTNGFYTGRASSPLITAFIPRFLYPDKPLIQLGAWFALEAGIAYKNENGVINNSVGMTIPGELYLDFGWVGVFAGCILVGSFFIILWNATSFYLSESNISGTIFGGYLLLSNLGGIGADLQIIITLLSTYVLFYILKRVI